MVRGMALVVDASIVTTELSIGLVVPKEEAVEVPETALLNLANAVALIRCRGYNVRNVESSEETSTCR